MAKCMSTVPPQRAWSQDAGATGGVGKNEGAIHMVEKLPRGWNSHHLN